MEVVTVYAAQAPEQQMQVFTPAPYNRRKVGIPFISQMQCKCCLCSPFSSVLSKQVNQDLESRDWRWQKMLLTRGHGCSKHCLCVLEPYLVFPETQ